MLDRMKVTFLLYWRTNRGVRSWLHDLCANTIKTSPSFYQASNKGVNCVSGVLKRDLIWNPLKFTKQKTLNENSLNQTLQLNWIPKFLWMNGFTKCISVLTFNRINYNEVKASRRSSSSYHRGSWVSHNTPKKSPTSNSIVCFGKSWT